MAFPRWIWLFLVVIESRNATAQGLYGTTYGQSGGYYGQQPQRCACSFDYRPVCGSNGKTYSNGCQLRCEQSYNPSIVQLSDGPCGVLGIGSSGVYGSAGVPSAVSFGPILSGSSILGSQYTANSCVWECPVSAGSYGGFYGSTLGPINQASPYIVGGYASSAFPYSSFSNTATGVYGESSYTGVGDSNSAGLVCDSRGTVHVNDCQYYRSACEWDKRGVIVTKISCSSTSAVASLGTYYGGRRSLRQTKTPKEAPKIKSP